MSIAYSWGGEKVAAVSAHLIGCGCGPSFHFVAFLIYGFVTSTVGGFHQIPPFFFIKMNYEFLFFLVSIVRRPHWSAPVFDNGARGDVIKRGSTVITRAAFFSIFKKNGGVRRCHIAILSFSFFLLPFFFYFFRRNCRRRHQKTPKNAKNYSKNENFTKKKENFMAASVVATLSFSFFLLPFFLLFSSQLSTAT